MRLFKRDRVWYCYVYEGGKRVQHSTRCHDRRAAEAVARELERRAADPAGARAAAASLSDALKLLLDLVQEERLAGKASAGTETMYKQKAAQLVRVLETEHGEGIVYRPFLLAGLTAEVVDGYISRRRSEEAMPGKAPVAAAGRKKARPGRAPRYVSEHTIHKELTTLRKALRLAQRRGLWRGAIEHVLPAGFSPEYKPRKRWLPVDELQRLLATGLAADRAARIAFMAVTSARWAEGDAAQRDDVAPDRSWVRLRGTKTAGAARVVPIVSPEARSLLAYAVQHAGGVDGALFLPWQNRGRDIKAACARAGIAPCTPNDLRRSFAQWLRREGVPAELVAPAMGHSSPKMVREVYGELDADALGLQIAAHLGIAPKAPAPDCITSASQPVPPAAAVAPVAESAAPNPAGIPVGAVGCEGNDPSTNGLKGPATPPERAPKANTRRAVPLWPKPSDKPVQSLLHQRVQPRRKAATPGRSPAPRRRQP